MKRFLLIVTVSLFPLVVFGQSNNLLKDAQDLFAAGDYSAAVTKFQEAVDKLSGEERNIAQIQLGPAKTCFIALSEAEIAESSKDYKTAISEYQKVLDENPNDTRVKELQKAALKSMLEVEANTTLTVSMNSLSFSSSGGTQYIIVNCNMNWTLVVDQTSSICSVSRNEDVITVTCTSNSTTSTRNTSFLVRTANGAKEQRIFISQAGQVSTYTSPSYSQSTTRVSTSSTSSTSYPTTFTRLYVKPTSIHLTKRRGSTIVDVSTDAEDYQISGLPSWINLKDKNNNFFILTNKPNHNISQRNSSFFVKAGERSEEITVTQRGINNKIFTIGLDLSVDYFDLYTYNYFSLYKKSYGYGFGLRARIGRYNQFFNLVGGIRGVVGYGKTGLMAPAILNMNLIRINNLSLYLGGGYEFRCLDDSSYYDDWTLQGGILYGPHTDLHFYYKLNQRFIGVGFTYYL